MKQLPLALSTHTGPTFDNYVPGSNLDSLSYLQEAVDGLATALPTSCYLWGDAGSGKTHLLKSIAKAVKDKGGLCLWLTSHSHLDEEQLSKADVVLLDDCEQYNEQQQALAFRVFIDAQTHGVWIVSAGLFPPIDLQVREDLRTRLGWGHVFALKLLSEAELQAALWHAFYSRGLTLSPLVQDYLLHHFERDMSSLMRLLGQLDRYALASKRAITIPLIKSMLEDEEYLQNI